MAIRRVPVTVTQVQILLTEDEASTLRNSLMSILQSLPASPKHCVPDDIELVDKLTSDITDILEGDDDEIE